MLISSEQNILIKSFLTGVLNDYFRLIYAYLNEGDKVCECYGVIKMVMQAHLYVNFLLILFIFETVAIKHNFLNKKIIMKCLAIKMFA